MRIACEECRVEYDTENPALNPVCSDCAAEDRRAMERVDRVLADPDALFIAMGGSLPRETHKDHQPEREPTGGGGGGLHGHGGKVGKKQIPWMDDDRSTGS